MFIAGIPDLETTDEEAARTLKVKLKPRKSMGCMQRKRQPKCRPRRKKPACRTKRKKRRASGCKGKRRAVRARPLATIGFLHFLKWFRQCNCQLSAKQALVRGAKKWACLSNKERCAFERLAKRRARQRGRRKC